MREWVERDRDRESAREKLPRIIIWMGRREGEWKRERERENG